ncbi:MAG: hypothetical protein ACYSUD_05685 [Planctomycetota bacterium]|jgi:hypothetical protein
MINSKINEAPALEAWLTKYRWNRLLWTFIQLLLIVAFLTPCVLGLVYAKHEWIKVAVCGYFFVGFIGWNLEMSIVRSRYPGWWYGNRWLRNRLLFAAAVFGQAALFGLFMGLMASI